MVSTDLKRGVSQAKPQLEIAIVVLVYNIINSTSKYLHSLGR